MIPRPRACQRLFCAAILAAVWGSGQGFAESTLDFANGLYARKMYGPALVEYEKFLLADPASPESASARFRYADSFYFMKEYDKAVTNFDIFMKAFPADKRVQLALFRTGSAKYYQNEFAPAVKIFLGLSQTAEDPNLRASSLYYLGKSYDNRVKSEKSIAVFERLILEYPQSEYASYAAIAIGDHYLENKNYDEAIRGYKVAAEKENPIEMAFEARFRIAEIHFMRKDYMTARDYYERMFSDKTPSDMKDKALLGLFYCDYYLKDAPAIDKRLSLTISDIQKSAYHGEIRYLVASLKAEEKNYEGAMAILEEILADSSISPEIKEKAAFKKASILAKQGKKDLSLAEIDRLFTGIPTNPARAHFEKAELLVNLGKPQEALESYEKVFKDFKDPEYSRAAIFRGGLLHMELKNFEAAKEVFEYYISQYPLDELTERARLTLIQIDLDAQNFDAASKRAVEFIRKNPKNPNLDIVYYKLGVAMMAQKRHLEAADAFLTVRSDYPKSQLYPDALYGAGSNLETQGMVKEALPFYETIVEKYPDHPTAQQLFTRLGFLYIKTDNFEKVKKLYEDILFNRPAQKLESESVFWLVQYLLDHGHYDEMQKVLAAIPDRFKGEDFYHEIQFYLGEAAMGRKDYPKALENYTEAIRLKPDGSYAGHARLGSGIAHLAMGDMIKAENEFNEALKFDHEIKVTMRARFEIANNRIREKNYEEAAKGFMRVAILYDDPKYTPLALYKAGECFVRIKRTDDALKAFEELKTRYPNSKWAKKTHV